MPSLFKATAFLAQMRFKHQIVEQLPENVRPNDLSTAYRIQDGLVEQLLHRYGGRRIGYKVACTNKLAQEALNVSAPLFGQMLSFSSHDSPTALKAKDFTLRIVEAEFGIRMAADVPERVVPYDAATITEYIETVLPGIEIVSHRFADWSQVGAPSVAADNAIHGAWVYGEPYANWRSLDLAAQPVTLTVNGNVFDRGSGANVLGHPLNVVAWLANELPKHGKQLRAGDSITTGVVMNVYLAEAGDKIVADFGEVGKVELSFV